jgi:hypothetical protein
MALSVIILLYVGIGVLAAGGSIAISSKRFSAKAEQIFYGLLLVPVAAIYLAFTAYYAASDAWRLEALLVAIFAVVGLLGTRLLALLMLGYAAHGAWDLVHELSLYQSTSSGGTSTLTQIPLAYGAFCAAYDWCMVGYFYTRRHPWRMAWQRR